MRYFFPFAVAIMAFSASAHLGPHDARSNAEMAHKAELSSRCAQHVAQFNDKRWKRSLGHPGNTTVKIHTQAPYYDVLQNDTCVLSPEVTAGPYYWPRSQILRQDMTESQVGVPLWLDIGVMDMATCSPLEGVMVDLWHCNATGSYSSFTELSPNTKFPALLAEQGKNASDFVVGSTDIHTDSETWLRGMWPTDDHGMMQMKTIFPGFYVERTIHIHVQVHTDWTTGENGTLVFENTVSTGQLYFDEKLEENIMAMEPYSSHTQINRTRNDVDMEFSKGTANGYNPVVSVVPVDENDLTKGLIGYITIGVDTSAIEDEHWSAS
ncbi:protocatechuate 3,4-dioxygenase beta subunit [Aspergillus oryzae 100-8]|uniref:Protocatechuate 3,4-dioxygenase beta subunit n=1 Tax=Aspergillus oryzae (strain 3.042) TaxID=1160506 RepID=I8A645_ASPO3|nr:protocatechuate 3,4-dioxygenase beta subunit [Aspergillus oryzae 3.042]KDE80742.1 protocatechuate 3,4-dioxygenase beta subunit [Aspergillus oryzae 100-8]|eukprot:EIT80512.1 protocatechuate 3,4-dioxygenase beta subunit [Aspergillus oryzae 3.042]